MVPASTQLAGMLNSYNYKYRGGGSANSHGQASCGRLGRWEKDHRGGQLVCHYFFCEVLNHDLVMLTIVRVVWVIDIHNIKPSVSHGTPPHKTNTQQDII